MSKLAKIFLVLIFLVSVGLPPVGVKIRDIIQGHEEEIKRLGIELADTQEKLRKTEEERENLKVELSAEKKRRAETEAELRSTEQKLSEVKGKLRETESDLKSSIAERDRLQEDIKQLEQEKLDLDVKLAEQTKELNALKQLAGIEDNSDDADGEFMGADGRVVGVYGRFVTVSFNSGIGDVPPVLFAHRRGKVLGKFSAKKFYKASVVIEADTESLAGIEEGTLIKLEGEGKLLRSEFFEGKVSKVLAHGFVSIEVDNVAYASPDLAIYGDGESLGKIEAGKIKSVVVVAELASAKPRARVASRDYLMAPK